MLRFGIVPGADLHETIEHGYAVHLPLSGSAGPQQDAVAGTFLTVDGHGAVVEAVKLAEDGSGDVVVRLYEAFGGRRRVGLRPGFSVRAVSEVDLLEDADAEALDGRRALAGVAEDGRVELELRPFQIVTLRLERAEPPARS